MSNKTIRIKTTPGSGDKYIKIKLEQEFDFLEVLSLKISQQDAYRNYCSSYGCVTGRVIMNNGIGVPNSKVSLFVPISEIDKLDSHIKELYPYEMVTDKDRNGVRYNLLPRYSETNNECFTPIGTFPSKREVLDNPEMLDIYCKYYKFTTTTNNSGDFMLFGVPVGTHQIHVDVDISDIGIFSQRPYNAISQGTPAKMFESPTKFKGGQNLDKLLQIKTADIGVNVRPFWGDIDSCEIGISRVDVDLNYNIQPSAIFMGSIFGDHEKNSINLKCFPRNAMGTVCEQVTNEGTIEMIRKTLDGGIEKFDIQSGRVIDANGSWSYEIPMNLDYMVTSEDGKLIPSEDPKKGIPTRTSVRFKINMDETGGLGRLRTRAKYLVPNNPGNVNEVDYSFDQSTQNESFRDLYWNKIYSVSNYISRFQRPFGKSVKNRHMVGVKDVDNCVGSKNAFPYNRVNTENNPLFMIICLIMKIVGYIAYIINKFILPMVNIIIGAVKKVLGGICTIASWYIGWPFKIYPFGYLDFACEWNSKLHFIPYITITCNDTVYAPGGKIDTNDDAYKETNPPPTSVDTDSLLSCVAFQLAKALHIFQFDFYNDWINGSLYSYLLKYRKNKNIIKYCEYDCKDLSVGGDGNECRSGFFMDTCFTSQDDGDQFKVNFNEGLIKKYNGELYYAATNHNVSLKVYATDIINLGSVFDCDWQGIPKIQKFLTPTTYLLPPDNAEYDKKNQNDVGILDVLGQCKIDDEPAEGLFFKIECIRGLLVDQRQCLNIRKICEFGVMLPERIGDTPPNDCLSELNLDGENGKLVRNVFYSLNNKKEFKKITPSFNTDFNIVKSSSYNFSSKTDNGNDYIDFRGVTDNNSFKQPKNSFYFYFGLAPGKTGLDKMNGMFFTKCFPELTNEFLVIVKNVLRTSTKTSADGSFTFKIMFGTPPFNYNISGPKTFNGDIALNVVPELTFNYLPMGDYTITVTDKKGEKIIQPVKVNEPIPLFADGYVSKTVSLNKQDGAITITEVDGGTPPYSYVLYNSNNGIVKSENNIKTPVIIDNLAKGNYHIKITDSVTTDININNLDIGGEVPLTVSFTIINQLLCEGSKTAKFEVIPTGGTPPYTYNTILKSDPKFSTSGRIVGDLGSGTYVTSVTDSKNNLATSNDIVITTSIKKMKIEEVPSDEISKQCDPNNYTIKFYVKVGGDNFNGKVFINYCKDGEKGEKGGEDENKPLYQQMIVSNFVNTDTPVLFTIPLDKFKNFIDITISDELKKCYSNTIQVNIEEMKLPRIKLTVNDTGIKNTRQCNPKQLTFKFNISYLQQGFEGRAPLKAHIKINGVDVTELLETQIKDQTIIRSNQQEIKYDISTYSVDNKYSIDVYVTDNKDCSSPETKLTTITMPITELSGVWESETIKDTEAKIETIKKWLVLSGGIPPYTVISGPDFYNGTDNTKYEIKHNERMSSTVEDSVGCQKTFRS